MLAGAGGEQVEPRLAPTPVLAQGFQYGWTQRQITILAALAFHHSDDHALAIDVADLETSEFAASHAGGVKRHQQRPSKQRSGRIDQARNFFTAQHSWQPASILGVRQEITELMPLERLDEKESQRRYPVDHRAGRQLALCQQVSLIGSKFVGTELVRGLTKILGELGYHPQVIARGDGGIVATLELFQHHLA